jgi:hypothetical protein
MDEQTLTDTGTPANGNADSLSTIMAGVSGTTPPAEPIKGEATGKDSATGTETKRAAWTDQLPDEIKANPETAKRLAKFAKMGDMAKAYLELEGKAISGIVPPGKDATSEDQERFWEQLGVPKEPGQYTLAKEKEAEQFVKIAHGAHLTNEQAHTLYDQFKKMGEGYMQSMQENQNRELQSTEQALHAEYGTKYPEKMQYLTRGLRNAGPNVGKILQRAGISGNLDIVKTFIAFGQMTSESSAAKGSTSKTLKSLMEGATFHYKE